jgi:hypothetical protein
MKRATAIILCLGMSAASVYAQENHAREQVLPLVYESAECGIKVTVPTGWVLYQGMRRHPEILAVFSRVPYEAKNVNNPKIVLMKEKPRKKGPGTPIAKAYRDAEVLGLMKNVKDVVATKLLEGPTLAKGGKFAHLTYEITERSKDAVDTVRSCEYVFMKDGVFYTLLYGARPEFFDRYRKHLDRVMKSLTVF